MPVNRYAQIRYNALDKCFSHPYRKYRIQDLEQACKKAIYEFSGNEEGVKRRQVYEDIKFMESESGFCISLLKEQDPSDKRIVYYRYEDPKFSISKKPLNDHDAQQIKDTLLTLSRFKGMPQFEWIEELTARLASTIDIGISDTVAIQFDENPFLKGLEFINPLYQSIQNRQALDIEYRNFAGETFQFTVSPFLLKQYNKRWFFLCGAEDKPLLNLALDRIISINHSRSTYKENLDIDFNEYFCDVVGVTVHTEKPIELVKLRIENSLWPYIETKPLHESQKKITENCSPGYIEVHLEVKINYELEQLLFSHGERIKVLEPLHLAHKLRDKAVKLANLYD